MAEKTISAFRRKSKKKSGKFRKNSLQKPEITQEDLSYLLENTSFSEKEIIEWFRFENYLKEILKFSNYLQWFHGRQSKWDS